MQKVDKIGPWAQICRTCLAVVPRTKIAIFNTSKLSLLHYFSASISLYNLYVDIKPRWILPNQPIKNLTNRQSRKHWRSWMLIKQCYRTQSTDGEYLSQSLSTINELEKTANEQDGHGGVRTWRLVPDGKTSDPLAYLRGWRVLAPLNSSAVFYRICLVWRLNHYLTCPLLNQNRMNLLGRLS